MGVVLWCCGVMVMCMMVMCVFMSVSLFAHFHEKRRLEKPLTFHNGFMVFLLLATVSSTFF